MTKPTPDYAAALERACLGLMLLDPRLVLAAERTLTLDDFEDPLHARLYETLLSLARLGQDTGAGAAAIEMRRTGGFGPDEERRLTALIADPGAADPRSFDERVRLLRLEGSRRRTERLFVDAADRSRNRGVDLIDVISAARSGLGEIEAEETAEELPSIGTIVDQILPTLETGIDPGTPTGLPPLDEAIQGGFRKGQMIVLAGATGIGKTSMGTQIALLSAQWVSRHPGRGGVLLFSLEMGQQELVNRMVNQVVPIQDGYRAPHGFSRRDLPKAREGFEKMRALPIHIEVPRRYTVEAIRAAVERFKGLHGAPSLVIVDHIGLMKDPKVRGGRTEEVSAITRNLKEMAMHLDIPVLAIAQLNREVGKRDTKKPQLTDLRESGCLTGDAGVFLPDEGVYRPIRELMGAIGTNVLAINTETWKLERHAITNTFSRGRQPIHRLRTALGREIRATANHQFLTIDGWRRLDALAVGDRIAAPRALPSLGTPSMSDAEISLLGHLIGDGCTLSGHAIQYTTNELELAELVAGFAREAFGSAIAPRINRERNWYQVYLSKSGSQNVWISNPVTAWLKQLGAFDLRSYEKRVPTRVFAQPKERIARFLRHLWATDGCLNAKGVYPYMYYATSSQELASDVSSLLLRFGINARIRPVSQGAKGRMQYHVIITGRAEVLAFLNEIGTVGKLREARAAAILARLPEQANTNRDLIPRSVWHSLVTTAASTIGMTNRAMQAELGLVYNGTALYQSALGRERAARVANVVRSPELAALAKSDVYWDKIVSIEPGGEEEVYDLTVERRRSFVANDIVIHNSVEQDSNIVLLVHIPSYFEPNLDERRRIMEAGAEAWILVAKNRSGPTSEVRFDWVGPRYLFRVPADWDAQHGLADIPGDTGGIIESGEARPNEEDLSTLREVEVMADDNEPELEGIPTEDNPFA
jgi:replicative DNA helicase